MGSIFAEVGWLAGWRGLKIWVSLIDNCYYAAFGRVYGCRHGRLQLEYCIVFGFNS